MPRGYEEGPVAEEAQARIERLERGEPLDAERPPEQRRAVYGSTPDQADPHFIGWADEVDQEELFRAGKAWGLSIRQQTADKPPTDPMRAGTRSATARTTDS